MTTMKTLDTSTVNTLIILTGAGKAGADYVKAYLTEKLEKGEIGSDLMTPAKALIELCDQILYKHEGELND